MINTTVSCDNISWITSVWGDDTRADIKVCLTPYLPNRSQWSKDMYQLFQTLLYKMHVELHRESDKFKRNLDFRIEILKNRVVVYKWVDDRWQDLYWFHNQPSESCLSLTQEVINSIEYHIIGLATNPEN